MGHTEVVGRWGWGWRGFDHLSARAHKTGPSPITGGGMWLRGVLWGVVGGPKGSHRHIHWRETRAAWGGGRGQKEGGGPGRCVGESDGFGAGSSQGGVVVGAADSCCCLVTITLLLWLRGWHVTMLIGLAYCWLLFLRSIIKVRILSELFCSCAFLGSGCFKLQ